MPSSHLQHWLALITSDVTSNRALIAMLQKKFRLRTLLISLFVGGVMLTSVLLLGALLLFQKCNIEDSLMESNIAYARKLADTMGRYLAISLSRYGAARAGLEHNQDQGTYRPDTAAG